MSDALDPENQPISWSGKIRTGSRALWLTENVWHQKYDNKIEGLQNYLKFLFNSILNISTIIRGTEPWIQNFAKTRSSSLPELLGLESTSNTGLNDLTLTGRYLVETEDDQGNLHRRWLQHISLNELLLFTNVPLVI